MRCTKCGKELSENAQFCPDCGATTQTFTEYPMQNDNDSKRWVSIIIICALSAAIIVLAIAIILGFSGKNSKSDENAATQTTAPTSEVAVVIATPEANNTESVSTTEETILAVMYVVNCNEYITLRTSPSTSAAEITKIPLGASVGYKSDASNGFYKVSYNGQTGYALAAYLSSSPQSNTVANSGNADSQMGGFITLTVVNCDEWISLRTSPSTAAERITTIPLGAKVNLISDASNGFYKISYNGRVGYALAEYLE